MLAVNVAQSIGWCGSCCFDGLLCLCLQHRDEGRGLGGVQWGGVGDEAELVVLDEGEMDEVVDVVDEVFLGANVF